MCRTRKKNNVISQLAGRHTERLWFFESEESTRHTPCDVDLKTKGF